METRYKIEIKSQFIVSLFNALLYSERPKLFSALFRGESVGNKSPHFSFGVLRQNVPKVAVLAKNFRIGQNQIFGQTFSFGNFVIAEFRFRPKRKNPFRSSLNFGFAMALWVDI